MTDADWLADLNACLLSAVRLDREVLPVMIAAGGGAIVHPGTAQREGHVYAPGFAMVLPRSQAIYLR